MSTEMLAALAEFDDSLAASLTEADQAAYLEGWDWLQDRYHVQTRQLQTDARAEAPNPEAEQVIKRHFAAAFARTPREKWSELPAVLVDYPIDLWPWIKDAVPADHPDRAEWTGYEIPGTFAVLDSTVVRADFVAAEQAAGARSPSQTEYWSAYNTILRNKQQRLNGQITAFFSNGESARWVMDVTPDADGYKLVAKQLLGQVFDWAQDGEYRTADMAKARALGKNSINPRDPNLDFDRIIQDSGGKPLTLHTNAADIAASMDKALRPLQNFFADGGASLANGSERLKRFAGAAATAFCAVNEIHPMRIGVSEISQAYFKIMAQKAGFTLDWMRLAEDVRKTARRDANIHYVTTGGIEGDGDTAKMQDVLEICLEPTDEDEQAKPPRRGLS